MTTPRRRLDAELVRRGLATGRDHAKRLIDAGDVVVNGSTGAKAATLVAPDATVVLAEDGPRWASRGALKLIEALDAFGVDVAGTRVLDVGASHGGFTDVVVARDAAAVVAVDVGYGQLAWHLRQDPRVTVLDRTNFRTLDVSSLGGPFDVIVMDVSFISAAILAENLAAAGRPGTHYVVLVKPQFEVGKDRIGRGGIVSDPSAHAHAVTRVAGAFDAAGIGVDGLIRSPITGSKGNVEFLVHGLKDERRSLAPSTIDQVCAA